MAAARRLNLKAEIIARPASPLACNNPYAQIWVDTGVRHLDFPFDYGVSETMSDVISPGVRVQVPFNGREVEGLVLRRVAFPENPGQIKLISKALSPHSVANEETLNLIEEVAKHWVANPWDIVRGAIPPRVASVDRVYIRKPHSHTQTNEDRHIFSYVAFDPFLDPAKITADLAVEKLVAGSVLIIAPDERDVHSICNALSKLGVESLRLDSSVPREVRYRNFLTAMDSPQCVVVGARGAIFSPVNNLRTILIFNESSHGHFEVRSPGWNVRDIAIIRKKREKLSVIFTGYVPSLELSLLIENKELAFITHEHRLNVKTFSSSDGAILPGRIFTDIRSALAKGPVLFLMPRKGYGNALLCAHCKNMAKCICGGRLILISKNAVPQCAICSTNYPDWKCEWCQRDKKYVAARGIERAAEEISRAFPNTPTLLSFGNTIKERIQSSPAIVLATPGAAPRVHGGFSAVVILEGLTFFSHPDLRAQERARELFFETAALVSPRGAVLLCIDSAHPVVASMMRWNPGLMIRHELAERLEIPFPPFVSTAMLSGLESEFTMLATGLRKAISDSRLPASVKFFGPMSIGHNKSKIVLYFPLSDSIAVKIFLAELQRRRSIARKEPLGLRIDPYSL